MIATSLDAAKSAPIARDWRAFAEVLAESLGQREPLEFSTPEGGRRRRDLDAIAGALGISPAELAVYRAARSRVEFLNGRIDEAREEYHAAVAGAGRADPRLARIDEVLGALDQLAAAGVDVDRQRAALRREREPLAVSATAAEAAVSAAQQKLQRKVTPLEAEAELIRRIAPRAFGGSAEPCIPPIEQPRTAFEAACLAFKE